ncbi:MAG: hypothetical protein ACRDMH_07095 [Solirubrobacterales bacterium]
MILIAAQQSGWTTAAIATIVAAAVSAIIALLTLWVNGVRKERSRRQQLYADALAAVAAYREFPYVIRRRRAPAPGHEEIAGEERVRISEALRQVQRDITSFSAWMKAEPTTDVSVKYDELVSETRRVAGGYMHEAWKADPLDNDAGMNIPGVDYSSLAQYETAYLDAVRGALTFWRIAFPWFARS